ncbi:MAG TPA: ABC transporter ATP-binding protein [Chloroflexota bacterium]|jgi:branched-chain amino acid transport system ATP-binding protein
MLEVRAIQADYGGVRALWGVSARVDAGQIVALIGPNGAGKTTLMRTIVGLHTPSSGGVFLEGQPLCGLPPHRIVERGVVLVPEGRHIFASMSVLENLELGAYAPAPRRHRASGLERVFGIFPALAERTAQLAGSLSGGQQQMLAVGRALMGRPRLLLLDEPSLGLAPLIVRDIFAVIREVNREGVTVLLVEQNARVALQLADYAYILEQGRVAGEGTGAALLQDDNVRRAYLGDALGEPVEPRAAGHPSTSPSTSTSTSTGSE